MRSLEGSQGAIRTCRFIEVATWPHEEDHTGRPSDTVSQGAPPVASGHWQATTTGDRPTFTMCEVTSTSSGELEPFRVLALARRMVHECGDGSRRAGICPGGDSRRCCYEDLYYT